MRRLSFKKLTPSERKLLLAAQEAMEAAYNPYSCFFVGASLQVASGEIISGSNVENAADSVVVCAERAAMVAASSLGHKIFKRIAVVGRGAESSSAEVISPCGVCRQMLLEASHVADADIEVIMSSTDMKKIVIATAEELLPLGFGPHNLGLNLKRFRSASPRGRRSRV